jgi:hypothetical protein
VAAQNNMTTSTVAQSTETVGTTLNVPVSLWKRVRNLATHRRVHAQSLWIESMTQYLDAAEAEGSSDQQKGAA